MSANLSIDEASSSDWERYDIETSPQGSRMAKSISAAFLEPYLASTPRSKLGDREAPEEGRGAYYPLPREGILRFHSGANGDGQALPNEPQNLFHPFNALPSREDSDHIDWDDVGPS